MKENNSIDNSKRLNGFDVDLKCRRFTNIEQMIMQIIIWKYIILASKEKKNKKSDNDGANEYCLWCVLNC